MNSPSRLLNSGVFHHLLKTPIGINLLQFLSRGLSNLELLLSSQPHKNSIFSSSKKLVTQVIGFPIGLSPRTMQCLGSVQNPVFLIQVVGFPIGLSLRTMQCLGSVQNPVFLIQVVGFPIGLSPRTLQYLSSVQNPVFLSK